MSASRSSIHLAKNPRARKRRRRVSKKPSLFSMANTVGGDVFRFVINNLCMDLSKGKEVLQRHTVIVVAADFFQATKIARTWVQQLESEGGEVVVRSLRRDNIDDVFWPYDQEEQEWLPLLSNGLQLFRCTYAELVEKTQQSGEETQYKEVQHHLLVATATLEDASDALQSIMAKVKGMTVAKDVKRTTVENVLTYTGQEVVEDDESDAEMEAEEEGEDLSAMQEADEAEAEEAAPATPSLMDEALSFALSNAPVGGPKASVTTVVVAEEEEGEGGDDIPLPEAPALSTIEEEAGDGEAAE